MTTPDRERDLPALILGTGLTVLGVMRCLAAVGIPAFCLSSGLGFEAHSRWCRRAHETVDEWDDVEALGRLLESSPWDHAVVIACSDHWTIEASKLPNALRGRFPTCLPTTPVLESFIDKSRFARLLTEADAPHPLTETVRDADHLRQLMARAPAGVFLKPAASQRFLAEFGVKAFRVSSVEEALDRFHRASSAGLEMMLQEYVAGAADRHYFIDGFVDDRHRIAASFARRRLRMFPPDFGNSSYVISIAPSVVEDALASLGRVFTHAGYRGIFSAEFKQDADGEFKLIEINCRPWWYVEFAATCGVNVVAMAHANALGRPFAPAPDYRSGVGLMNTYYDYLAFRRMRERCQVGAPTLVSWLRDMATSRKPVFRNDDPLPALTNLESRVRSWCARRLTTKRS